jgi:hypothetical protein
MSVYRATIPLDADDEERAAALDDVGRIYAELRDQGVDVVVGVEPTPSGDEYTLAWDEPVPA